MIKISSFGQELIRISITLAMVMSPVIFASSLIEVSLRNPVDLQTLLENDFDVTYVSDHLTVEVVITDNAEITRLLQLGMSYQMTHVDLENFYAERLQPIRDDMGGYRTFDEIETELFEMWEDFNHIVAEPISIGESIEGRPIWAVKISDNPEEDEDEAEILFTAATHAREVITPEVLFGIMYTLIEGYDNDEEITRLVDERQSWFITCVNPDGYFFNGEDEPDGGGLWRKNRRENDDGSIGVDLNRNWAFEWGRDNGGSSPRGRDPTYRGEAPFSEPETQSLREFINAHEFTISLNFHGYGNLALIPYGYDYVHCPDRSLFTAIAQKITVDNGYLAGTGWEVIYLTNGESDDWLYGSDEHDPILAITPEVGTNDDGFWPARNRVETLVNDNIGYCLTLIDLADTPRRALPPLVPDNPIFYIDNGGITHVEWENLDDEINPAARFEIMGRISGEPEIDNVENGDEYWDFLFASVSEFQPRSNPTCFRFNPRSPLATITSTKEILAPDSLWAWLRYDLSRDNNFALEITTDGVEWIAAPGLHTEDVIVDDYNHGPGIFRNETNGWERHWWDLADWENQMIRFRFRYYKFVREGRNDFVYLDDIGPLPVSEWEEILTEDAGDLEWIDEENNPDDGIQYHVRSIDAEGDASFWSSPAAADGGPDGFKLYLRPGWSANSIPVDPVDRSLRNLLELLIEHENLIIFKNAQGQFIVPEFGFWGVEEWDPLQGYLMKMQDFDSLFIQGDRLPVDTPLMLNENWNLTPYYPDEELPAEEALATIAENVIIAKNDQGRFWYPEQNFNNMDDLQIGQAYLIKLEESDTLIYPLGEGVIRRDRSAHRQALSGFTPPGPDNHSILLQINGIIGGEIVLRDDKNEISGILSLDGTEERAGIAAWGQPGISGPGYAVGESFRFFWRTNSESAERKLEMAIVKGDKSWVTNGFSLIELKLSEVAISPDEYGLIASFPNPFNSKVRLTFRIESGIRFQIAIFNNTGAMIYEFKSLMGNGGYSDLSWDASDSPSGLYFARILAEGHQSGMSDYQKLLLIR